MQLTKKRECRVPTIYGWLILLSGLVILPGLAVVNLHRVLAVTAPVKGEILIIEGWLPDYALEAAVARFQEGNYGFLITTGGPLARGSHLVEFDNFAEVSAATLRATGFDSKRLVVVPTPAVQKDRTYASSVAVKEWIEVNGMAIKRVDVFTLGPHARRSWLLYEMTFQPQIEVGIIATQNRNYDAEYWWRYSSGIRTVLSEAIAYCYAKFMFFPEV
jgi:hypothetical protein